MIEYAVGIPFEAVGKLAHNRITNSSSHSAPIVHGFLRAGLIRIIPKALETIFENIEFGEGFVHLEESIEMLSSLSAADPAFVHEEEIFRSFDDGFVGFGGFLVFQVAHRIDDTAKGRNHVVEIEHDLHMRDFVLDGFDIRVPHVHGDGLQALLLLFGHQIEEFGEGFAGMLFFHPDHPAGFVIQDNSHVSMAFLDGDFVDCQDSKAVEFGRSVFFLQEGFVDFFDRFPIQLQMLGHLLDRHNLAEFVDILSHALGHAAIRVEALQILDANTLAGGTEYFSIPATEKDFLVGKAQIPNGSLLPIVDRSPKAGTPVADRTKSGIRYSRNVCDSFFLQNFLFHQFHSTKRKIRCYSELGHREPPFWMCDSHKHNIQKEFPYVPCFLDASFTH